MAPRQVPFCPNIAATPDGKQVWFTLKDTGRTQIFDAQPPFSLLKTLDTGPITNHVNIVRNANGMFAYVTVGGLDEIRCFARTTFPRSQRSRPASCRTASGRRRRTRVYVGLENEDKIAAVDTLADKVIAESPVGQAPQALVYVPNAIPAESEAAARQ